MNLEELQTASTVDSSFFKKDSNSNLLEVTAEENTVPTRQNRMNPEVFRAASIGNLSFFEQYSNINLLQVTAEKNTVPTRQNRMNPEVFRAASTGNLSFFEEDSNINLLQVTAEKNTVLHVALQFKKLETAEKIVKLRPSLVLKTNSKDNTPLHVAARVGTSSIVKLLIYHAKKQDVEAGGQQQLLSKANLDGDTALHVAVRYGNFEVVKELINEKDPAKLAKQVNNAGESALFLAVDRQHYNIATHILKAAPDCSYAGRHGMNVLHALVLQTSCYCNKGNLLLEEMEKMRQENEAFYGRFSRRVSRRIFAFLWITNMLFLIPIPKFFFGDDGPKEDDRVPIPWAEFATIPEDFVKEVMKKCPSTIEQRDDFGWTALHIAAHTGNEECVKLLLENGNSPAYVRNKEGLSALHIAAKEGNKGVIDILMKACPDIYELLDNKGRNVLHVAAETRVGWWSVIRFFKKRPELESLINEQDEEGNTPMNLAAINGEFCWALNLMEVSGVDLNATNKQGFTTMDNLLLTSELLDYSDERDLWKCGARPSLRGALLKMGIQKSDPTEKPNLPGDGNGDGDGDGNGDGNDNNEGKSASDFFKQVREGNMLVATLIATVTFTAAFTVPGGYNQNGYVGEGLAVLRKKTAFRVFLIANTIAFGLSTTSVFVHFLASATIDAKVALHKKLARCIAFYTNWSIGAMLVAFIAGTYTMVPQSLGISVAVILSCCFLSSMFLPFLMKSTDFTDS